MPCRCRETARASVSEVLLRFYQPFLQRYGSTMSPVQRSALQSILLCRTEAMGGHRYRCTHCRHEHFAWHSCNHRLCPRCGAVDTAAWVAHKLEERLSVDHYLVTVTLPAQLRPLCLIRGAEFYRKFSRSSSRAVKGVLADPRHLGGQCGFMGMFQSWRQDLLLHPHIHFIVPGIGLGKDGNITRLKRKGWLVHGEVFAKRLKSLLLNELRGTGWLDSKELSRLWAIKWNCDVKCFGNGENALKYLGRYVFKGPISDARIHKIDTKSVWIRVKDRKSRSYHPVEIEGVEFVRRYLLHALPSGFHRIRYYGFLHGRSREKLTQIRRQLGAPNPDDSSPKEASTPEPTPPIYHCPRCGNAMTHIEHRSRAPPWRRRIPRIWNTHSLTHRPLETTRPSKPFFVTAKWPCPPVPKYRMHPKNNTSKGKMHTRNNRTASEYSQIITNPNR